jgi:hypothetical protein
MSDVNSVKSYSDEGSSDGSDSERPVAELSMTDLKSGSVGCSSVSSTTFKEEQLLLALGSFDKYDETSDRLDDDIDVPFSAEEELLMLEIETEQKVDDELEQDVTTRAALLTSPLLMAASSEVVKSGGTSVATTSSFFSKEASVPEPSKVSFNVEEPIDDYDYGSDLDGEITEEDLQFGQRADNDIAPDQVATEYEDPFLDEERKARRARSDKNRRIFFIVGYGVASVLVIALIVALAIRPGKNNRSAVDMQAPSGFPTLSPQPTMTPRPTGTPTIRPTQTPTRPLRTRSPSREPTPATIRPFTLTPTSPQEQPAGPAPQPTPSTLQPSPLPTITPSDPVRTNAPSVESSFSDEEVQRRADITSMVITVSGMLALLDPQSPQFQAMQWILNDDPLQLLASDKPQILQRYVLATLYFSTNGDTRWDSCGPPSGTTPCGNVVQRFLSGAPGCMWLGVNCDVNQEIEGINIRKYIQIFLITALIQSNKLLRPGGNGLDGELPPELTEMSRLSSLSFSGNSLTGTIPTHLGRLERLRFLVLNDNHYTGTIPTHLGQLSSIYYLHLGKNGFTGSIPPEIFVPTMQHFDVGGNQLVGTIPAEMHTVSEDLLNIDISDNRLVGTIPAGLGGFPSLNSFTAANNTLTGTLPGEIISDTLTTLDVGINQLRGTLPPDIYMFGSSLSFVNLGINGFGGTISPRFGELLRLETLVFFFNDFTGTIPNELGQLPNLGVLHFAGTSLQGTMPTDICNLREDGLKTLTSNCGGTSPEVECSCCTFCFE